MNGLRSAAIFILPFTCTLVCLDALASPAPQTVDFRRDVAPILEQRCVRCHRPDHRKGKVSLISAADLIAGGHVVPGNPDQSTLLDLVVPDGPGGRPSMPKEGEPLSDEQVNVLRHWIAAGAGWPDDVVLKDASRADGSWWSLQPLSEEGPPSTPRLPAEWAANPIDRFVHAKLSERGLPPGAPADRRTLIRRLSFDLTGLPPTPEEIDAFVSDPAPDAYERLVDRLLDSPSYGEQWGRHWLDVVRFGESNGFERNVIIDGLWPFRDYVIRSFNEGKPFDRMILEQVAGDVVAAGDPGAEVGTAFLVCGPYDNVGNQDAAQAAVIRADTIDEMIRATGEAFLGLTVGCARCHDHKFDPIMAADYYAMYATFAGVHHDRRTLATPQQQRDRAETLRPLNAETDRLSKERESFAKDATSDSGSESIRARLKQLDDEIKRVDTAIAAVPALPSAWAGRFEAAPGPFHVFLGGDPKKKGEQLSARSLSALKGLASAYHLPADVPESQRRLALAQWITAQDNPLTPRVLANRLWHYHFGTGIVESPSDFGYMGGRPSHPELLDWLARQVHASGWRLKPLHRLIVTSQTYRQASTWRESAAAIDGANRLLWRFPPRRLTAEQVRDAMLLVAGKLDLTRRGGPGFRLYKYIEDNVATYVPLDEHGPETYRRSVYHQNARAIRVDVLSDFDCPDPAAAAPRRASTTTPLQALAMMNHRFAHDMAAAFAQRLERELPTIGGNPGNDQHRDRVRRAFLLAFGREPAAEELAESAKLIERVGLKAFCLALLNANELIHVR